MRKKKRNKVGRHKKYETAAKLSRAVNEYFDAISYELPYTNEDGTPICNLDGEEIILVKYITPPSLQELCLHLKIDKSTWENYSHNPLFAEICADAKLKVEAYLTEQVNTRDRPQGVIFNLENNFDWRKKSEVEVGEKTREAMRLSSLTIEEKQKLLEGTVAEITGFIKEGQPEDDNEDY